MDPPGGQSSFSTPVHFAGAVHMPASLWQCRAEKSYWRYRRRCMTISIFMSIPLACKRIVRCFPPDGCRWVRQRFTSSRNLSIDSFYHPMKKLKIRLSSARRRSSVRYCIFLLMNSAMIIHLTLLSCAYSYFLWQPPIVYYFPRLVN